MAAPGPHLLRRPAMLLAASVAFSAAPAAAQILPWEVVVAEIESGRLRHLAERLSKQNLLYQLHLGGVLKSDLVSTAGEIDQIIESLEKGHPAHSIPPPWTPELREQVARVYQAWGPLRRIAMASAYEYLRVSRQFMRPESSRGDLLGVRYFDNLSSDLIEESEKLVALYDDECVKTGLTVCATAKTSGYAAMLIERAAKEVVYLVAGIDVKQNRKRMKETIAAYHVLRRENDESPFFAEALDPERGASAAAAGQLLASLREDWDALQSQVTVLTAGDEENFDLDRLLLIQARLVAKVERLSAALVRYASFAYGS